MNTNHAEHNFNHFGIGCLQRCYVHISSEIKLGGHSFENRYFDAVQMDRTIVSSIEKYEWFEWQRRHNYPAAMHVFEFVGKLHWMRECSITIMIDHCWYCSFTMRWSKWKVCVHLCFGVFFI